jgi:hypothetical protein
MGTSYEDLIDRLDAALLSEPLASTLEALPALTAKRWQAASPRN